VSEEKKKPEMAVGPPAPAENPPVAPKPDAVQVEGPGSAVTGATAQAAEGVPAPTDLSVPDEQELVTWNKQVRLRMRQKSRRSFLGLAAGFAAGFGAWEWLTSRREVDGIPWPFRKTLETNEQLARDYFRTRRLAPTFAPDRVGADRVNGDEGLEDDIDVAAWNLQVQGLTSQDGPLMLGLDAIQKLPRLEMTTELKCIEGWSVVVRWAGARFTDFMRAYPPKTISGDPFSLDRPEDLPPYVGMATPDAGYYVGLDMESMLHPQTLLCYEMNGSPLSDEHGAPLRLVIAVKYGVKNIKRIGTIRYSTRRPADYWAERGYDWYIGL
jgi:DMSO/TMAO reductase YedYZ molybdopterin-dependent catalytic subunit